MAKVSKLHYRILVVVTLFLVSFAVFSQTSDNWRLATWSDDDAYFYAPNTITRPQSGIIRVWITVQKNWKSKQIEKDVELNEYNCSERKIRVISRTSYDSNGKVLKSISSESSSWDFVVPDSVGEEMLEILCLGKADAQSIDDAHDYYDEAEKLANNKRFAEAVPLYKKAIALKSNYWFFHNGISKAYLELKQYPQAIFHANKAIEFADSNIVYLAYHNLGTIYEKQMKFDLAIQTYKKAANLNFDCSFCEYGVVHLYEKSNRFIELLAFYESRSKVSPIDIELLVKIGDVQKKLKKEATSFATYNKALQTAKAKIVSPDVEAKYYDQLAEVYSRLGQIDNEIETYRQGLRIFPKNQTLRNAFANSLNSAGKYGEAIYQYKLAIANYEDEKYTAWLYSALSNAEEKVGQIIDAIESMKKAVELEPTWYDLHRLAELYRKSGNFQLAFETINKSLKQKPTAASYKLKGELYEAQKQPENARIAYQEAVKLCAKCSWVYSVLGEFFIRQKDKVSAMKQYQILKSLDPKRSAELLRKIQAN